MNNIPKSSLDAVIIDDIEEYPLIIAERHEILPGLWLGSDPDGKVAEDLKYVMSLNGASYTNIPQYVVSTYFEDGLVLPPEPYLKSLADTAVDLWDDGSLLIHCAAGLNRSAMIMGLVLIRHGMTASDALILMREKRSKQVLFNPVFRNWLLTQ